MVMNFSSSRQGTLLSLAPLQRLDDRTSRPSSSPHLRRRVSVHSRNADNYCLSGVLINELQISVPRSARTEPNEDLSHGNRRRHSALLNQVCKNKPHLIVGKDLTLQARTRKDVFPTRTSRGLASYLWPFSAAIKRGVQPLSVFAWFTAAPLPISTRTTSVWPCQDAQ